MTSRIVIVLVGVLAGLGLIGMTMADSRQREDRADDRQAEMSEQIAACLDAYGAEPGGERAMRLVASGTCP